MSSSEILQELKAFSNTGSVLYIAAHPDDENTRMISYLSKGRGLRTGYLSLTRGDGGQNLIGPELRERLGVIRTQELLEARKIDGAEQFFSRAVDFGYSKSAEETLSIWDRQEVLADVVRVIREFRPDVIVTRFSPTFTGTHGHHVASAQLALEAFRLSGDPDAFPEQLESLQPWQPERVFWNSASWGRRDPPSGQLIRIDMGGYNPVLGMSFGEIAAQSRSMHKSQGFGSVGSRGESFEDLELLVGSKVEDDLMDGIDVTWKRLPGGEAVETAIRQVLASYNLESPAGSLPHLIAVREALLQISSQDLMIQHKLRQLDSIIFTTIGLHAETLVAGANVIPGDELSLKHNAIVRADVPVTWLGVEYPSLSQSVEVNTSLVNNREASLEDQQQLPADASLTNPYWLREPGSTGMFSVSNPSLIGRPESEPDFPVKFHFEIQGQRLSLELEPVELIRDPVKGEVRQSLVVSSPVVLSFFEDLALVVPGSAFNVTLEATAARAGLEGQISLVVPHAWKVSPESHALAINRAGEFQRFTFTVQTPPEASIAELFAEATIDGRTWNRGRVTLAYDHIEPQVLHPLARMKVIAENVIIRGERVGYIHGAGDAVPEALVRLGYQVRHLSVNSITTAELADLDAVVLGVRAFNTQPDLMARMPVLLDFVRAGGNLIVQYNTNGGIDTSLIAPYHIQLSRLRVTDESASVRFLNPEHPALTCPNKISQSDFENWVQERGLYFPSEWGPEFQPLLSWSDPGEAPADGGLLIAPYGDGYYVYTGLSFFRQLPAGVPGAYRLFANLISLGE